MESIRGIYSIYSSSKITPEPSKSTWHREKVSWNQRRVCIGYTDIYYRVASPMITHHTYNFERAHIAWIAFHIYSTLRYCLCAQSHCAIMCLFSAFILIESTDFSRSRCFSIRFCSVCGICYNKSDTSAVVSFRFADTNLFFNADYLNFSWWLLVSLNRVEETLPHAHPHTHTYKQQWIFTSA